VTRKLGPVITVIVAAALVALLVFGLVKQGTSRALDAALAAGREPAAPNTTVRLPVLDDTPGATAALTRWRGGVVIVNFWASWCPSCNAEAPLLERAERSLVASHAGTVVGITYKDVSGDALSKISSRGLTYPNLRDADGSYAAGYGTDQLPETFVLNGRQHVVALSRGPVVNEAWFTRAIAKAEKA
jgi:cytochrome c biogenesis protein CcmG/thiol:disulfide interchange protein DsbE